MHHQTQRTHSVRPAVRGENRLISLQVARLLLGLCLLLSASACSTLSKTDDVNRQVSTNSLEGWNRGAYKFNDALDKAVLRPVAVAYDKTLPAPAKRGVGNFFSNLGEPMNVINNLLQGKFDDALRSTYRFTVNSTIGLLGFIDVAKKYDVDEQQEDFGQTLAAWGVAPGPYIVIPFLGPSNLRDSIGFGVSSFGYYPINDLTDTTGQAIGASVLSIVHTRSLFLDADQALDEQPDPYLFMKTIYDNNRIRAIYDGDPPANADDELDDF